MATILTIANQKGGVGKTTTATNLADLFARFGYATLLIDLDSQGNVANSLGIQPGRELTRLLLPALAEPLRGLVQPSGRQGLEVVRSDKTTAELKSALAGLDFRELLLAQALDDAAYDIVLIDCAPSVDLLQTMALVAADWLLIPTRLDQLAVKGIRDLLVSLSAIHKVGRTRCQLVGILPTFYDRVTGESQRQLDHLVNKFSRYVLPPIPTDTQCREATRAGQTLAEFAPSCRALAGVGTNGQRAGGYLQVFERLKERL